MSIPGTLVKVYLMVIFRCFFSSVLFLVALSISAQESAGDPATTTGTASSAESAEPTSKLINLKKVSMGSNINSAYDEIMPVLSPDGKTLYFCREGHPQNTGYRRNRGDQDIWFSKLTEDGTWKPARRLPAMFNTITYDFPVSTNSDGRVLYIGNIYYPDGRVSTGISKTKEVDGKWILPEPLFIDDYYNDSDLVNFSVGVDEQTMILNLQRKDSNKSLDLYVSQLTKNNKWTAPVNIGPAVNTEHDEVTPFLAADMRTLYFSSNRPGGSGGYDNYVSRRIGEGWDQWSPPVNLGDGINTRGNDISFTVTANGEYGVYSIDSSDRGKELFKVSLPDNIKPKPAFIYAGVVTDESGKPANATVFYEELSDGKILGQAETDPETGGFKVSLTPGSRYGLHAKRPGYLATSTTIDLRDVKPGQESKDNIKPGEDRKVELEVVKMEPGSKIPLRNIFFEYNSAELNKDSTAELLRVIETMEQNPEVTIELAGHTDSKGGNAYNMKLSKNRADSVMKFLLEKGVEAKRVKANGYGEAKPVASNKTEQGRSKNRRVELIIVNM